LLFAPKKEKNRFLKIYGCNLTPWRLSSIKSGSAASSNNSLHEHETLMAKKAWFPYFRASYRHRFFYMTIAILSLLAVMPLVESFIHLRKLFDVFLTTVFVSGIYAVSQKKTHAAIAIGLIIPLFVSIWAPDFDRIPHFFIFGRICGIVFFAFTLIHILRFIISEQDVTIDLIAGAASVYLLMALMWAFIFQVLELFHPGSFDIPQAQIQGNQSLFIYYSFVTITTLGYGDITPISTAASSFSILEAVVGQLFLVVLISWLVGMHVSNRSK
jgi:voltage-gated potassium channel